MSAVLGLALGYGGGRAAGGGGGGTSTVGAVLLLVLGIVLTVVGIKNWRNRGDHSEPAVLAMIGRMGPLAVASLALGATILNPKNLVILLGAGQALTSFSGAGVVGAAAGFVVLATLPYTAAAVYAVAGGVGARERLDTLRNWLIVRNRAILGSVAIVIGLALVAKSLASLL